MLKTEEGNKLSGLGELGLALEEAVTTRRRVFVTRDFYATSSDQLSVFTDDTRLELVDDGDGEWWLVKDRGTGREGRVPADIVEEAHEREARVNAARNSTLTADPHMDHVKKSKTKKRAVFAKGSPKEIPHDPIMTGMTGMTGPTSPKQATQQIQQIQEIQKYVEYDPQLEERLRLLLIESLDDRPGQLIRVYPGPTINPASTHYKTVRVDGDMTVQEMILAAALKYTPSHCTRTSHHQNKLYMRHLTKNTTVPLDPRWRLWQVTELAKLMTVCNGDDDLGGVDKKTVKWYRKVGKRYAGVEQLQRRSDLDFCTRFQFVFDRL